MTFADRDKYGMYKDVKSAGPGPALMGADTLIGDSVVNGADEDLGDVKEIMLDMHTGQVAYAVLAFGGFLGMGEKLFAVPWQALHLDTVNKRFVLNVDKERLKTAPGFNKDAWPDMSDMTWANQIHAFYGTDPNRAGAPTMGPGAPMGGMIGGTTGAGAAGMGAGMAGSVGAGSAGGLGAGSAGQAGLAGGRQGTTGTAGRPSTAGTSAGISSGSGSSTTGGAGSSSMGSGLGGSSGLGAGTGSGAGGDLGAGTAAGTGSGSRGRSSTGTGTGSGVGPDVGTGSASKPGKPGGSSDTDI